MTGGPNTGNGETLFDDLARPEPFFVRDMKGRYRPAKVCDLSPLERLIRLEVPHGERLWFGPEQVYSDARGTPVRIDPAIWRDKATAADMPARIAAARRRRCAAARLWLLSEAARRDRPEGGAA